jgi:hypothetical protein
MAKNDKTDLTADNNTQADQFAPKTAEGDAAKPGLTSTSGEQAGAGDARQQALEGALNGNADGNVGSVTTDPLEGVPTEYVGGTSHEEENINVLSSPINDPRDGVPLTSDSVPKYDPENPYLDGKPNLTEAGQAEADSAADALGTDDKAKVPKGQTRVTAIEGFTHGFDNGDVVGIATGESKNLPSDQAKELLAQGLAK